ncbi:hypothetical protein [Neisseria animalis]|nr:hypothetical protein [Neisseria animalis]
MSAWNAAAPDDLKLPHIFTDGLNACQTALMPSVNRIGNIFAKNTVSAV